MFVKKSVQGEIVVREKFTNRKISLVKSPGSKKLLVERSRLNLVLSNFLQERVVKVSKTFSGCMGK